ncbi:unnamed protein product [Merluccius merluccius]
MFGQRSDMQTERNRPAPSILSHVTSTGLQDTGVWTHNSRPTERISRPGHTEPRFTKRDLHHLQDQNPGPSDSGGKREKPQEPTNRHRDKCPT